jgi:DNA-binding transcriptional LysR family regulator
MPKMKFLLIKLISLILNIRNIMIHGMNPQINLLHLKYFCDSVTHNSISDAAKMNFVTQSAVSQAINKLEISLGKQILVHTRQKFQVTPEGRIVFEEARHIFKAIQNMQEKMLQKDPEISGKLKIATTKSLGMSFIAPTYKKLKEEHPLLESAVQLGGLSYIRNCIRQNEVEFGIVVYDQDFAHFEKHPIQSGKFRLYQNKDSTHDEQNVFVNYFEGTYVSELRDYLTKHTSLKITSELSGWEVIARFTEINLGIGFYPDYIMANKRYLNIKPYPLKLPSYDYEICAIYNKGEKLSRAATAFLESISMD